MTKLIELNALRVENGKTELKAWKQSKEKLDAAIVAEQDARAKRLADEGEGTNNEDLPPSDLSDLKGQTDETLDDVVLPVEVAPRGAIGAMSIDLLTGSDEPYADIVAKIVARYPSARTTARSLASVAMDLRRDGVDVPSRRKPAKGREVAAG